MFWGTYIKMCVLEQLDMNKILYLKSLSEDA